MCKPFMSFVRFLACAALVAFVSQFSQAQEAKAPVKKEDAAKAAAQKPKQPAEPKGRLPNFYNEVVNKEQRETIYKIQMSYDEKIDALTAQLQELMAKRNADVEKVLTPEQLKKIKELQAASKEKAKSVLDKKADAKTEASKTDAKPAEPAKKPNP